MTLLQEPKKFKYEDVKSSIAAIIDKMQPGSKMPSERHLARSNQCNMQTVRKALSLLADEGRVERRAGAGTFVADATQANQAIRNVGILLHAQADSYALRISGDITHLAGDQKLILHTQIVGDFAESSLQAIATLKANGCACGIVPWMPWDQTQQLTELVRQSEIPLSVPVLLPGLSQHYFGQPETFGVSSTHYTKLAGEYFLAMGYQEIAFIGPLLDDYNILERKVVGYTHFVNQNQLNNHCFLVPKDNARLNALAKQLARHAPKLAVICFDDSHAVRFMTAMHKLGLQAPQDFAILGWGNTPVTETCDPPLSSIEGDYSLASIWLLKNAIGLARGKVIQEPKPGLLQIHVRQSCGGKLHKGDQLPQLLDQIGFSSFETN